MANLYPTSRLVFKRPGLYSTGTNQRKSGIIPITGPIFNKMYSGDTVRFGSTAAEEPTGAITSIQMAKDFIRQHGFESVNALTAALQRGDVSFEQEDAQYWVELADQLNRYGNKRMDSSPATYKMYKLAEFYLNQAILISLALSPEQQDKVENNLLNLSGRDSMIDMAQISQCLEQAENAGHKKQQSILLYLKGMSYFYRDEFSETINHYLDALDILDAVDESGEDDTSLVRLEVLNKLYAPYVKEGTDDSYRDAQEVQEDIIQILKDPYANKPGTNIQLASAYSRLGEVCELAKSPAKAIEVCEESLRCYRSINSLKAARMMLDPLLILTRCYLAQNNRDKASECCELALQILESQMTSSESKRWKKHRDAFIQIAKGTFPELFTKAP